MGTHRFRPGFSRFVALLSLCIMAGPGCSAATDGETSTAKLQKRLAELAESARGRVGVAVVHVESGQSVLVNADEARPLYSVFKLPLAIVVLKDVQEKRLRLDEPVTVTREERSPGIASNTQRWAGAPMAVTIGQLLEYSLVESDNTASDKLMSLLGGPAELTKRVSAMGFEGIDIRIFTREMGKHAQHPNRGNAKALAALLAGMQRGNVLTSSVRSVLFELMTKSRTGIKRLRGALPVGIEAMDKSGTGPDGSAINDVGIITLPGQRGHLAIAVLMSGSKLPASAQEEIIAKIGRAAYDAYLR
ncbi:MAG: class A beta-lactamase [Candidatus Sumerlaeaceae bacterium]